MKNVKFLTRLARNINKLNPTTHGRAFIAKHAICLLGPPPSGTYTVDSGIVMNLDMTQGVDTSIYFHCFEPLCLWVLNQHLRPGGIFVDIGANIGFYSLEAAKRVGPHGRVIAFEANPAMAKQTLQNAKLSLVDIELFNVALSNEDKNMTLYCSPRCFAEASLCKFEWDDMQEINVEGRRLDEIMPPDIDHIDFIKVDVEGAEYIVFEGGRNTISRFHPIMLIEINEKAARAFGHDTYDAAELLLTYYSGYTVYAMTAHHMEKTSIAALKKRNHKPLNLLYLP